MFCGIFAYHQMTVNYDNPLSDKNSIEDDFN